MAIIYTQHLKNRLKERNFPENFPKLIYEQATERYYDNQTGSLVAIKQLFFKAKIRKISVFYVIAGKDVKIISIHQENDKAVKNRISKGRYEYKK